MFNSMECFFAIHIFFFLTTILFIVVSFVFMNRSRHLKQKLSKLLETLALKNKELEELNADSQNLLSSHIPETSRSIIISLNASGKIIDVNDYASEVFGYTKEELIDADAFGTIFPAQFKNISDRQNIVSRILSNPKLYIEHETENIKKSGEHIWISWTNRVIYNDSGEPTEIRSVGFDITKRKQLEEELKYLATIDPLTGVLNRQSLIEAGMHELKRSQRYKRQLSVLIMKLDYFHGVNEHRAFSDEIVRQVISICRSTIRDSDIIGRVGDVEFAIILPETTKEKAVVVSNRIHEKIQEENMRDTGEFFVTVSFGFSEKTSNSDTIDTLLLDALNDMTKSQKKKTVKNLKKKGI